MKPTVLSHYLFAFAMTILHQKRIQVYVYLMFFIFYLFENVFKIFIEF